MTGMYIYWFVIYILAYIPGSVYTVVAVALERYFNICKPFSRNLVSSDRIKIWCVLTEQISGDRQLIAQDV